MEITPFIISRGRRLDKHAKKRRGKSKYSKEIWVKIMNDGLPLDAFKDKCPLKVLVKEELWVSYNEYKGWMYFSFVTFNRCHADGSNIVVDTLMKGEGCVGLRELRHTWWGSDGYIYCLKPSHLVILSKWLSIYFDE